MELLNGSLVYVVNTLYASTFNYNILIPGGEKKYFKYVQIYLQKNIANKEYYIGLLGTHSHRKFSVLEAKNEDAQWMRRVYKVGESINQVYWTFMTITNYLF